MYDITRLVEDLLFDEGLISEDNVLNFKMTEQDYLREGYTKEQIENEEYDRRYKDVVEWRLIDKTLYELLKRKGFVVFEYKGIYVLGIERRDYV